MIYLSKVLIINIFIIIICLYNKANAQKQVINILINNRPGIEQEKYLENYNLLINQYFNEKKSLNGTVIPDVDINFSFCEPNPNDGKVNETHHNFYNYSSVVVDVEYARDFNCTIKALKNKDLKYDMLLLDDRFLFSDKGVDFAVYKHLFTTKKLSYYYFNYEKFSDKDNLYSFHNKDIFKGGQLENTGTFGLPYEIDFDLLYYHNDDDIKNEEENINDVNTIPAIIHNYKNINSQNNGLFNETFQLLNNTSNQSNSASNNELVSIGLGNNDELLDLFSEFIHLKYNIPNNDNSNLVKILKDDDMELYNSFKEYLVQYTGTNLNQTLSTSINDAYNLFINKNIKYYKGKASNYHYLKMNNNIEFSIQALPNYTTVMNKKYLVINKNSNKEKRMLFDVANILTSEDIQLYRAKMLGSIPTIDLTKKDSEGFRKYCQINQELCELVSNLYSVDVENMFKIEKGASLMEIRLVVPSNLKKSLQTNNYTQISTILENIYNLNPFNMNSEGNSYTNVFFISRAISTAFVLFTLIVVIVMVYINRKHPYLKAISPDLSILTIIGMIMNIAFGDIYIFIKTEFTCRLYFIIKYFISSLIYYPMFAIIFRIYYIYTNISKVNFGKKLNDKYLLTVLAYALIIVFLLLTVVIGFVENKIFYMTSGTAFYYRYYTCQNLNIQYYTILSYLYSLIMVNNL